MGLQENRFQNTKSEIRVAIRRCGISSDQVEHVNESGVIGQGKCRNELYAREPALQLRRCTVIRIDIVATAQQHTGIQSDCVFSSFTFQSEILRQGVKILLSVLLVINQPL